MINLNLFISMIGILTAIILFLIGYIIYTWIRESVLSAENKNLSIDRAKNYKENCNLRENIANIKQEMISEIDKTIVEIIKQRISWNCLAVHKREFTKLPPSIAVPLFCRHVKGKLSCPSEITILLINNYKDESIAEKSLRYVGINNFVVLQPQFKGHWFNALKLLELKKFLDSGSCKTKFILFLDSDDVVLRDSPEKAIKYLQNEECDLLLSSTTFNSDYECMPQTKEWADQIAFDKGYSHLYMNTGVYIGKTCFVLEIVNSALEYITEHDLSRNEYRELRKNHMLSEKLTDFPKGVGCDQIILRYLHPRYYPRMKIDYKGKLALR